jgi:ABC-type amino acid transport substrate-binding protein
MRKTTMLLFPLLRRAAAAALLLATATTATAVAQETPSREARIRQSGELRVCIWPDYFAISYRNPRNDQLEGIDVELAGALARDLGARPVFVETSFVSFMDELDADRCDVAMFAVGITPARQKRVAFTAPYLRSGIYAVTTKAQQRIARWEDIDRKGSVVAVQAGTFMEPLMRGQLKEATLMVVVPPATRETEIESGRADVFISDFPYTRRMVRTHDWARIVAPETPVAPTDYAYAVRAGDPAWLARVDAFVAAIKADGRLKKAAARYDLSPIVVK